MNFTCSVCNEEFENKYFDIEQNKCILHCDKNESNNWYTLDKNKKKIWNDGKVNQFWNLIKSELDLMYRNYLIDTDLTKAEYILSNVVFPKFQDEVEYFSPACNEDELGTNFYSYDLFQHPNEQEMFDVNTIFTKLIVSFDNCTFLDDANFEKYDFEHPILFKNCIFKSDIQLNKIYKNRVSFLACTLNSLNCIDIVFEQKVKVQNCTINGEANFYNTKFRDLADFYRTKFNEVVFERTDFEKIAVFSEAEFKNDVDFKYTKFLGKSIFRDTVIKGKLNLRDTIFDNEATFLDITSENRKDENEEFHGEPKVIEVANRETARIIKNFYDKSNNIIEANKFYALEMQEREKELNKTILKGKDIVDWIIFKFHSLSSNHSQDPISPILWILNIAFIYSMFVSTYYHNNGLAYVSVDILLICIVRNMRIKNDIFLKVILIINVLIVSFLSSITFATVADKINPFSKIGTNIPFSLLLFKVVIAYLVYQFIVSVRQNTRRK